MGVFAKVILLVDRRECHETFFVGLLDDWQGFNRCLGACQCLYFFVYRHANGFWGRFWQLPGTKLKSQTDFSDSRYFHVTCSREHQKGLVKIWACSEKKLRRTVDRRGHWSPVSIACTFRIPPVGCIWMIWTRYPAPLLADVSPGRYISAFLWKMVIFRWKISTFHQSLFYLWEPSNGSRRGQTIPGGLPTGGRAGVPLAFPVGPRTELEVRFFEDKQPRISNFFESSIFRSWLMLTKIFLHISIKHPPKNSHTKN